MANPIAVPGTVVPSGSLTTPGGAQGVQGIQGIQGPTAVSADAGNLAALGSDSRIFVPHPGYFYGTDTTNSGAYVVTVASDFVLAAGVVVYVTPTNTNSGAPSLNVNGTGVKPVVNRANVALANNELPLTKTFGAIYDGASWRVITPVVRLVPTVANPGNIIVECAGFDGVFAGWSWSGSAVQGTGLTLNHLSYGIPVVIKFWNGASVACNYWVNCTTPAGASPPTYFIWSNVVGGGATTRIDSTAGAQSVPSGNNVLLMGSLNIAGEFELL